MVFRVIGLTMILFGLPTFRSLCAAALASIMAPIAVAQQAPEDAPFTIGVQTHFQQGWPLSLMPKVGVAGATAFRDGVRWSIVEHARGQYRFDSILPYMSAASQFGFEPLLVFHGVHPLHDDKQTPFTEEGRLAFANFVNATISAFPDQIRKIEVGNEINAPNFMVGPFEDDPTGNYAALIKVVAQVVRRDHPQVEIMCTGAHSVALAYFRKLFEAGALADCDAISLHPYRPVPEGVDRELEQLKAMMRDFGGEKPIYATEFGSWFEDPEDAPDFLVKIATLMAASNVKGAYWYALYDQPWWPNMGLFDKDSREKPAFGTFRFISENLLPLGRPVALGDDGADRIYAFGPDRRGVVVWGAPGRLVVDGAAVYFDAWGNSIAKPEMVGDSPIIILGLDLAVSIDRDVPAYDSLLQFGAAPWSYLAAADTGPETELTLQESNWAPYLGNRFLNPLSVSDVLINGTVFDGAPMYLVERFTAPASGRYEVSGIWTREGEDGDGADIRVTTSGATLAQGIADAAEFRMGPQIVSLGEGQTLDFSVGPNAEPGGDLLRRRITIRGPLP